MPENESSPSFEVSLKELEKIVSELERGDLPLEAQFQAFERGVALSRGCQSKLDEVEKRVEVLLQGADGKLSTAPFETAP